VVLLISLTCLSCQYSFTETAPGYQLAPIKHQKNAIMLSSNSSQGLPDSLKIVHPLWEVERQNTSNRLGSITRLYEDGQIYTWSNTRRIFVDGKLRRETAPYTWRLDAQLRPEGVTRVRELIRSEFINLPSSSSVSTGADQGVVIRRSHLEGIEHCVVLPTSATDDLPQSIRDIDYAIQSSIIPGAVPLSQ
jgi:hypothetical protein